MNSITRRAITLLLLFVPLLILLPGFSRFIFASGSNYSDLIISHYPNLIFLKNSLVNGEGIPLWSDSILSGYPFAADPLAALWFPLTWVLVWLPQPFGFNLMIVLHLLAAGYGIYLLVRHLGYGYWPAIISALSFELMPKLHAHYAAGHITMVFAVCITPWLILVELLRENRKSVLWKVLPGLLFGWIALADIRWVPYAGLIWLIFFTRRWLTSSAGKKLNWLQHSPKFIFQSILPAVGDFFLQLLVALGVSAPLLFPLTQFIGFSTRNNLLTGDRLAFSLPPVRMLGLIFPDVGGYSEWVMYVGIFSIFALLIVLSLKELRRENMIWLGVLAVSLFISLGSNNPIMPFIARLPGYEFLRVPTRVMFLGGLAFSMLAGSVTQFILTKENLSRIKIWPLFTVMAFSDLFFLAYSITIREFSIDFFWGAIGTTVLFIFIMMFKRNWHMSLSLFTVFLPVLIALDLGGINFSGFQFHSLEEILQKDLKVVEWLQMDSKKLFRVYSPSYSVSQLAGSIYQLNLADGIDPLQLEVYVEYMSDATGVKYTTYGVTVPPFDSGRPQSDNIDSKPDAQLLGILNVQYLVSSFPLDQEGFQYQEKFDSAWIYKNIYGRPRAWIQQSETDFQQNYESVEIVSYKPNRIELFAENPGVVVLSEIAYPGWKVFVDGKSAQMIIVNGLLRGVRVAHENAHIQFVFRPLPVYIGQGVAGLTFLFIFFFWIFNQVRYENTR